MYIVRKVRNENKYCVKCKCGFKTCLYKNCETYLSDKKEAEGLRDYLNKKDQEAIYDLDNNIITI